MQPIILRSFPSLVHLILSLVYFEVMLDSGEKNFGTVVTMGLFILITTNSILTSLISKGQWRQLLISIASFILFFIIYILFLVFTGDPNREVDDNPAGGIVLLFFGIPLSFVGMILGTIFGITVINLIKQVKKFYLKTDGQIE